MTETTTAKAHEFLIEMFSLCEEGGAKAIGTRTVIKHAGYGQFLQAVQRLRILDRSGHWWRWISKKTPSWEMAEKLHLEVLDQVRFNRRQRQRQLSS